MREKNYNILEKYPELDFSEYTDIELFSMFNVDITPTGGYTPLWEVKNIDDQENFDSILDFPVLNSRDLSDYEEEKENKRQNILKYTEMASDEKDLFKTA